MLHSHSTKVIPRLSYIFKTFRNTLLALHYQDIFTLYIQLTVKNLKCKTQKDNVMITKCIISRYFPVANLTRTRQAVIIEPLRPEKFYVKTFNATSLYILSICEVCGSYQCPYCPFYSSSPLLSPSPAISLVLAIISVIFSRGQS